MLKQYKFKIQYTSKKNDKTNVLNKKKLHEKKEIHYNILKNKNKNELLSTNQKKFNAMLKIQRNKKTIFYTKKQTSNIERKNRRYNKKLSQRFIAKTFERE